MKKLIVLFIIIMFLSCSEYITLSIDNVEVVGNNPTLLRVEFSKDLMNVIPDWDHVYIDDNQLINTDLISLDPENTNEVLVTLTSSYWDWLEYNQVYTLKIKNFNGAYDTIEDQGVNFTFYDLILPEIVGSELNNLNIFLFLNKKVNDEQFKSSSIYLLNDHILEATKIKEINILEWQNSLNGKKCTQVCIVLQNVERPFTLMVGHGNQFPTDPGGKKFPSYELTVN